MAAGNTYVAIATNTLGSAAASVTFSSIPGTYTDLVIVTQAISATADNVGIRFNSDSGSNYSQTWLSGNGTSAISSRYSSSTSGVTVLTISLVSLLIVTILSFER